jgi:hypothetical protein
MWLYLENCGQEMTTGSLRYVLTRVGRGLYQDSGPPQEHAS